MPVRHGLKPALTSGHGMQNFEWIHAICPEFPRDAELFCGTCSGVQWFLGTGRNLRLEI